MNRLVGLDMIAKRLLCMFFVSSRHIQCIDLNIYVGILFNLANYITPCSLFAEFCFGYGSILVFVHSSSDAWSRCWVLFELSYHNSLFQWLIDEKNRRQPKVMRQFEYLMLFQCLKEVLFEMGGNTQNINSRTCTLREMN